jgi:cell division septum initiation protein DivIVA
MDLKTQSKSGGGTGTRLLQKMLAPIVATAASAAVTYAAKKAPELLEDKVVPKVKDLMSSAARDLPSKAKTVAGDAGDVAEKLTERARSVAGGAARTASSRNGRRHVSPRELERRVEERERGRAERRKASK